MIKTCSKCKTEKPATLEFFSKHNKYGSLSSWCRDCRNNQIKENHKTETGKQQVANAVRKYNGSDKQKAARKRYEEKKKQAKINAVLVGEAK